MLRECTCQGTDAVGIGQAWPSHAGWVSVVKSFGPTVFMNFGPGRDRLQIASGASGVAESCGLGQAVVGAAETVRGTLRVAGNGAWESRAQRLGSGEYAAGGLAVWWTGPGRRRGLFGRVR